LISKIILSLFSVILLFQAHQVYADEELPVITINFTSGNTIDLDESPQMIRAEVLIHNYNPQDGYTFMEIIRESDGEIIKNTEVMPKVISGIEDNLFQVQILHYLEPGGNVTQMMGDYILRIYSEYGLSEGVETFSIIKSSMPVIITQNEVDESETTEDLLTSDESETTEELVLSDEYYDDLEDQLVDFCDMTDEEQPDFFSENSVMTEFEEDLVSICEMEDEDEREDALYDSIDEIILEIKADVEDSTESEIENLVQPESRIPSWVHDIFVWYADETISENELLTAIEYLITEGAIIIDTN